MPKWQRILSLIYQHNKQNLVRIRHDFGRELVVIASTGILLGLFFYMFHDFLHTKLNDLPSGLRQLIQSRLTLLVTLALGLWMGSRIQNLYRDEPGWAQFALRSGEDPRHVQGFRLGQATLLILVSYGILISLLHPDPLWIVSSLILAALFASFYRPTVGGAAQRHNLKPILNDAETTRSATLRNWRWYQMLQRNRLCRLCIGLSLLLQLLIAIMHALSWPLFLAVLVTMVSSALLAWALAFQLEEDMRAVWFERQLGCSHEEFIKVYEGLSWRLGCGLALLSLVLALGAGAAAHNPLMEWLKLLAIAALFPIITPSIMFQVAPDRPLLQIMLTGLIGLFLATAIYAQILSIFLVPILIHQAKNYQKDNFYRS